MGFPVPCTTRIQIRAAGLVGDFWRPRLDGEGNPNRWGNGIMEGNEFGERALPKFGPHRSLPNPTRERERETERESVRSRGRRGWRWCDRRWVGFAFAAASPDPRQPRRFGRRSTKRRVRPPSSLWRHGCRVLDQQPSRRGASRLHRQLRLRAPAASLTSR